MTMREEFEASERDAGSTCLDRASGGDYYVVSTVQLDWVKWQIAYAAGQRAEREACAKACESVAAQWSFHAVAPSAAHNCAAELRNRKEQG